MYKPPVIGKKENRLLGVRPPLFVVAWDHVNRVKCFFIDVIIC